MFLFSVKRVSDFTVFSLKSDRTLGLIEKMLNFVCKFNPSLCDFWISFMLGFVYVSLKIQTVI